MGSLIEYFQQKKTTAVLEKAIDHAKKVQECILELQKGFKILVKERDFDKAHDIFTKVDQLEGEADNIRRDILADISKGELNPSIRTDLSHLIKKLDQVANCANGAGRRLNTVPMSFWEQTSERSLELMLNMMDATVNSSNYLDKIVIDLLGDRKNIKEYSKQINLHEHQVDVFNIKLRKSLQQTDYKINAFTVFTIGNTFDIMEAISDSVEEVADYIMVLLRSANVV